MKLLLLMTTGFALGAGVAAAQDPVFDWTGAYVGAQTGFVQADGHFSGGGDNAYPEPDGLLGGLYAGVNHQFSNNVVTGIEGDIAWSGANEQVGVYDSTGVLWPSFFRVEQKINATGAVRARVGYAVDRWLPYASGGIAFADVSQRLIGADVNFNALYTGWTVGVGTEYAFTNNMIFRAEYRHTDFGSKSFPNIFGPPTQISLKENSFRLGFAYKF